MKALSLMVRLLCTALGLAYQGGVAADSGPVRVQEVRRIALPRTPQGEEPHVAEIAWSRVTGQLAATSPGSNRLYLAEPESSRVLVYEQTGRPVANAPLAWSSKTPLLVVNREMDTRVYETTGIPQRPPTLVGEVATKLPKVLIASSLSVVDVRGEEWFVLGGETNRQLDPANREVAAFSLATREPRVEWRLPAAGGVPRMSASAVAAGGGSPVLAGWVHSPAGASSELVHRMWVVDLGAQERRCDLDVFEGMPATVVPEMRAPVLSDDGHLLVFAAGWGGRTTMFVYDTARCALLHREPVGPAPAYGKYTFSPDGRWLAAAMPMYHGSYAQGRLSIWSTTGWKLVHDATAPGHAAAAFNKASNQLAVGGIGSIFIYVIQPR